MRPARRGRAAEIFPSCAAGAAAGNGRWCAPGCGATRMKALRPGVSRVREELEALAGTPVAAVWGPAPGRRPPDTTAPRRGCPKLMCPKPVGPKQTCPKPVGPKSVWPKHEWWWAPKPCCTGPGRADAVAFLDFDAELLAPRLRAGEEALALLARAARLVGAEPAGRRRPGGRGPGDGCSSRRGCPGTTRSVGRRPADPGPAGGGRDGGPPGPGPAPAERHGPRVGGGGRRLRGALAAAAPEGGGPGARRRGVVGAGPRPRRPGRPAGGRAPAPRAAAGGGRPRPGLSPTRARRLPCRGATGQVKIAVGPRRRGPDEPGGMSMADFTMTIGGEAVATEETFGVMQPGDGRGLRRGPRVLAGPARRGHGLGRQGLPGLEVGRGASGGSVCGTSPGC